MAERKAGSGAKSGAAKIPLLEWIASAIGLLLTLGILAVIGRDALVDGGGGVPAIEVTVERVVQTPVGYVVEITASNRSDATAAAVEIEGELKAGGEALATSTTTIDYVPGNSERKAGLFFSQDPRRHTLDVRALGYEEP